MSAIRQAGSIGQSSITHGQLLKGPPIPRLMASDGLDLSALTALPAAIANVTGPHCTDN